MKNQRIFEVGCLVFAILFAPTAFGVTLSFLPDSQSVTVGGQAIVEIQVSDLDGSLVGAYDFNVFWDESVVTLASITFGSFLDGPALSLQDSSSSPGILNIAEVSFGPLVNQDGLTPFSLFTLAFDAVAIGVSPLSFSGGISPDFDYISDDLGLALPVAIATGEIAVVPLPGALLLLLCGLGTLPLRRKS